MNKPLIIRVSKINTSLILSQNIEQVFRVHLNGVENFNTLHYESASDTFNLIEAELTA